MLIIIFCCISWLNCIWTLQEIVNMRFNYCNIIMVCKVILQNTNIGFGMGIVSCQCCCAPTAILGHSLLFGIARVIPVICCTYSIVIQMSYFGLKMLRDGTIIVVSRARVTSNAHLAGICLVLLHWCIMVATIFYASKWFCAIHFRMSAWLAVYTLDYITCFFSECSIVI